MNKSFTLTSEINKREAKGTKAVEGSGRGQGGVAKVECDGTGNLRGRGLIRFVANEQELHYDFRDQRRRDGRGRG